MKAVTFNIVLGNRCTSSLPYYLIKHPHYNPTLPLMQHFIGLHLHKLDFNPFTYKLRLILPVQKKNNNNNFTFIICHATPTGLF